MRYAEDMRLRDGGEIRTTAVRLQKELGNAVRTCTQRHGKEAWYQNVLLGLATEAQVSCVELLEGDSQHQLTRSAWAARNLFELHYLTRYVLANTDNARRFHEDMICDYWDLMRKIEPIQGAAPIVAAARVQISAIANDLEQVKAGDKYLSVALIAKGFGETDHHDVVNKFLSKFVHPTSLSIHLRINGQFHMLFGPIVLHTAASYIDADFSTFDRGTKKQHTPSQS